MAEFVGCKGKSCPCGSGANCNWLKKQISDICKGNCTVCEIKNICPSGDSIMEEWKKNNKEMIESGVFREWYRINFRGDAKLSDIFANG